MKEIFLIQAVYFLITGIWPLLHIESFMKVTGPKRDLWLVKTVGVLVTAIAMGVVASFLIEEISAGVALLPCLAPCFSLLLMHIILRKE
jgi:hypothetical protein